MKLPGIALFLFLDLLHLSYKILTKFLLNKLCKTPTKVVFSRLYDCNRNDFVSTPGSKRKDPGNEVASLLQSVPFKSLRENSISE